MKKEDLTVCRMIRVVQVRSCSRVGKSPKINKNETSRKVYPMNINRTQKGEMLLINETKKISRNQIFI